MSDVGAVKHTPGTWKYGAKLSASENSKGFYVYSGHQHIADLNPINDSDGNPTAAEANALLIAAAPELLEALKDILVNTLAVLPNGWARDLLDKYAPLIHKAEGSQSPQESSHGERPETASRQDLLEAAHRLALGCKADPICAECSRLSNLLRKLAPHVPSYGTHGERPEQPDAQTSLRVANTTEQPERRS